MGVSYVGYRLGRSGAQLVIVERDGDVVGPLRHVVRHSPAGFNWGYAGSGPADLARSLLLDVLGADAWCPTCRGSGRVVWAEDTPAAAPQPYDPAVHGDVRYPSGEWVIDACIDCDDGYRHVPYQSFKVDVVATLADRWTLSAAEIRDWLAAQTQREASA